MDAHTDAHDEAPADAPDTAPGPDDANDDSNGHEAHLGQQDIRTAKLAARRAAGETEPYRWPVDHSLADLRAAHGDLAPDTLTGEEVHVAGRLTGLRRQGGLSFGTLRDRAAPSSSSSTPPWSGTTPTSRSTTSTAATGSACAAR